MKKLCPECGSNKLNVEMKEISCGACGIVIDDRIIVCG